MLASFEALQFTWIPAGTWYGAMSFIIQLLLSSHKRSLINWKLASIHLRNIGNCHASIKLIVLLKVLMWALCVERIKYILTLLATEFNFTFKRFVVIYSVYVSFFHIDSSGIFYDTYWSQIFWGTCSQFPSTEQWRSIYIDVNTILY